MSREISNTDDSFDLDTDYIQDVNESSIDLSKSLTVNGNNKSIDSKNTNSSMFKINNNTNIVFKNLRFNNTNLFDIDNSTSNYTIYLINCTFPLMCNSSCCESLEVFTYGYDWGYGVSCEIDPEIRLLAYSIVGKSKDLEAAEKLTRWVAKHIKYEKSDGFYQRPIDTLHRKLGNCCCQTDLLIQMMDAVGLTKNHEICYIHVGTKQFGKRHFFGMIDNICFDPGLKSPWANGSFSNRPATITKYPVMPLPYGHYGRA